MNGPRRLVFPFAAAIAIAGMVAVPGPTFAQQTNKNETGLPLYPNSTTGTQYPPSETRGKWYAVYTAESKDSLATVEDWYRHALPQAKETKDDNQLTHGIVLTNGKDRVLVYQLGKRPGAVFELQKYIRG